MPQCYGFQNSGQTFNINLDADGNLQFRANSDTCGNGPVRMYIHDDDGALYLGESGDELIRGDDPGTKNPSGNPNNGLLIQSAQTVEVNIDSNDTGADMFAITKGGARTEIFRVEEDGDVKAKRFVENSDLRLKQNIRPLKGVLNKVLALQGVNYEWSSEEESQRGTQIGLIAQEVEEIIPEAIETNHDGYKGIAYSDLVAILIESVKELYAQLNEQQVIIERMQKASGAVT